MNRHFARTLFGIANLALTTTVTLSADIEFNRDVRPILSESCFSCHGIDAENRQADLRLDVRESALQAGVLIPGASQDSVLWQRIVSADSDEVMPPPDAHNQLTADDKEVLRKWIDQGAEYQVHWAFVPPARQDLDEASIDYFVTRTLSTSGLEPVGEADRATLIRRVSFALTGLPPRLSEIERFLNDQTPDAYQRMVDQYLASPHFGEEMARHWLDVARYGDTHGMHLDNERQMWAYRDWVVSAFNRNLPYDQFTIEQLAGDLLPDATQEQIIATGFNRCNVTSGEGGSIDEELLFRYAVDRASTTSQAWLGLSAGCAVCHDHKYDPISTKEFYSLYAFFNSNADPARDGNALLTKPVQQVRPNDYEMQMQIFDDRRALIERQMQELVTSVDYTDPATLIPPPKATTTDYVWFEDSFPAGAEVAASGHPLSLVDSPVASGKKALRRSSDGFAQDYFNKGAAPLVVPKSPKFFLQVYLDPEHTPQEVMIQFHTTGWKHRALWGEDIIEFGKKGSTERFRAGDLPESGRWVELEIDGKSMGLTPGMKVTGFAFSVQGGTMYVDRMGVQGTVDPANEPRLSFAAWRTSLSPEERKRLPPALVDVLDITAADSDDPPPGLGSLQDYYLQHICESTKELFAEHRQALAMISSERSAYVASIPSTFVFRDLKEPRRSFVMIRGQYDTPGEEVFPGTPAALPPLHASAERPTRLDLARWLVSEENPLSARVAVNRMWQQVFGIGIVESSHDFGTQGSLPSHPELLDWLALDFQDNGWDVKRLMRMMVTSEAFRRDSGAPESHWRKDPQNRLLARGPRIRLDAEQLRDQALFVSGLMDLSLGGRGVQPYQPPNIWEPVAFGGSNTRFYKQGAGAELYRRTIYTFLKRTAPHPMLENFDAPNREQICVRRDRTNTPLQALQLMNDVQHFEAARGLAGRLMRGSSQDLARIALGFRAVLARKPSDLEAKAVQQFYRRCVDRFKSDLSSATAVIEAGDSQPPADLDVAELAAWTLVANMILNMDEAIMRN